MIRRIVALALASLVTLALAGAQGSCHTEEGSQHPSAPRVPEVPRTPAAGATPGQPDPHAGDPQPSNRKERVVSVHVGAVEKALLPADVKIYARGFTPSTVDDALTTSNVATYTLVYDANGHGDITVSVVLTPSRAGSLSGFCSIEAGPAGNAGPLYIAGGRTVQCILKIKRK